MPEDRRAIFLCTLETYADQGLYDKALALNTQIKAEGLDFPQFQAVLTDLANRVSVAYYQPIFYSTGASSTAATATTAPSEAGSLSMASSVSPEPQGPIIGGAKKQEQLSSRMLRNKQKSTSSASYPSQDDRVQNQVNMF